MPLPSSVARGDLGVGVLWGLPWEKEAVLSGRISSAAESRGSVPLLHLTALHASPLTPHHVGCPEPNYPWCPGGPPFPSIPKSGRDDVYLIPSRVSLETVK